MSLPIPVRPARKPVLPLVMILAWLAVPGCQRAVDPLGEAALAHAADARRVMHAGEATVGHGQAMLPLPADFPEDVFLPAGYRVESLLALDGARVVKLRAPGQVAPLFDDARSSMAALGWDEQLAVVHAADSAMASFEKGTRSTVLSLGKGERGEVVLSLQLRDRPQ